MSSFAFLEPVLSLTLKFVVSKPAGAYRPPGARGLAAPSIFKREDEGGSAHLPTNGTSTPPRTGTPVNNGANGKQQPRQRHVPGAAPPTTPTEGDNRRGQGRRKREKTRKDGPAEGGEVAEAVDAVPPLPDIGGKPNHISLVGTQNVPGAMDSPGMDTPMSEGLDPIAKKVRNLTKKVRSFEA